MRRKDLGDLKELLEKKGTKLYRGTGLTKEELKTYADLIGKTEMRRKDDGIFDSDEEEQLLPSVMCLTGFISTSLSRELAESFAWSNAELGKEATLFEIMWKEEYDYFVMDMSSFPEEKEVLLFDGCKFEVLSVDQTTNKKGEPLNIVVLKG